MTSRQYRPDIDGLRAIAVLSVFINHLSASVLPGGFIGVDIFFVISGFLITSQVHKEICEGNFSIKQFYKRRINRIAPVLMLVIVMTLLVGVLVLSPADLIRLGKSSAYAMVGLSNVFFWREYGSYFAGNSAEAPLLHTWSLGVEEQFYLIWPLLTLLLFKVSRRYMLAILAILTVAAVAVSQVGVNVAASAAYYLLPTRFFELMIGGVLALLVVRVQPTTRLQSQISLVTGFVLVIGSLAFIGKSSPFPGVTAVWPCIGAALLIWAGSGRFTSSRLLLSRPMVFIGLISYSLYLWHWPIIAYLNYLNIAIGPIVGTGVVITAVGLSWLSWKFVETPMRRTGVSLTFSKVFAQRFVIPVVALVSIGGAAAYTKGFPQRFDPRVAQLEAALESKPNILRSGCHVPTALYDTPPNEKKCRLGSEKPDLDGILIGDSVANHFTGMLDVMAKAQGISLMDYTMDGCPPILGYDTGKELAYKEKCLKRNEAIYERIKASKYSRVVLAGNWPQDDLAGDQLMSSIQIVLQTGAKVTLIVTNEEIDRASTCVIRRVMYEIDGNCEGMRKGPPAYFKKIAVHFPQIHIVDPNQVICQAEKCSPTLQGKLIYRDNLHLNDIGSRLVGSGMLQRGQSL